MPTVIQEYLTNIDQQINIASDEICMITQEHFQEDVSVEKCNQCKIVFSSEALQEWLKKRTTQKHCIVCAYSYDSHHFTKGKAHIIQQAVAVPPPFSTQYYAHNV